MAGTDRGYTLITIDPNNPHEVDAIWDVLERAINGVNHAPARHPRRARKAAIPNIGVADVPAKGGRRVRGTSPRRPSRQ